MPSANRYIVAMLRRVVWIELAVTVVMLSSASAAHAREHRSDEVPNAGKFDCGLCHVDPAGGGPRNPFGQQIEAMGLDGEGLLAEQSVVWSAVFNEDADGDGFTNGLELGDPDGAWVIGDGDPAVRVPSLPGDPDSVPCGTNAIHPGEECDGTDLDGQTCETLGFEGGELACNMDCTFDSSTCTKPTPDMGSMSQDAGSDPADTATAGGDGSGGTGAPAPRPDGGSAPGSGSTGGSGYGPYFDAPPPQGDVRGCAGSLEVTTPGEDAGVNGALMLLVGLWWGRRRRG